jgi:hypothetical protein
MNKAWVMRKPKGDLLSADLTFMFKTSILNGTFSMKLSFVFHSYLYCNKIRNYRDTAVQIKVQQ